MYRFLYFILWPFIKIVFPVRVKGRKNISKSEHYLFLSNHRSASDPVLLFNNIWNRQYYLTKKEFLEKRWKWLWITFGTVPIDRGNIDLTAIKTCLNIFRRKKSLVVFPEGTRLNDIEVTAIKNGAAMLAIKGKVKIVPIFIKKKAKIFRFNKMIIGEPFSLNQFENVKLTKEVLDSASIIISEKFKKLSSD